PPQKRAAIRALETGPVVRVVLRFRRLPAPIARREASFLHVRGAAVPTFWRISAGDEPVLVGWAAGPAVGRLPGDDEGRVRATVDSLARGLLMRRGDLAAE